MAVVALFLSMYVLLASQGVVGDKVYTVVANQSASSCPGNQTECSLMYYAAHPDEYFREDNTIFHFLPGHHQLVNSTLVLMANISNLTLYGTGVNESRVMCTGKGSGGFSFHNISNLRITNLSLSSCSYRSKKYHILIALDVLETNNTRIDNVNIMNTTGVGLSLIDVYGDTVIDHTTVDLSHGTPTSKGGNFMYYCSRFFKHSSRVNHVTVSNSKFRYGCNTYNRSESSGIHIKVLCSAQVKIVFKNVHLNGNHGGNGGNAFVALSGFSDIWTVSLSFLNCTIENGSANVGGGLCMFAIAGHGGKDSNESSSTILRIENTQFENNTAYIGGAVYLRLHQNLHVSLGAIEFSKNCTFTHNQLVYSGRKSHGGVAVHIVIFTLPEYNQHKTIFFKIKFSDCTFKHNVLQNSQHYGGSLPQTGALYTENVKRITLENCRFVENTCSGLVGVKSKFLLRGKNEIRDNTAEKGGGILFCSNSMMHLYNGTQLNITDNHASLSGGGVYVERECSPAVQFCFFQVDNVTADNETLHQTQVYLINNTGKAGSALYGGLVDDCILYDRRDEKYQHSYPSIIFNNTFHIHPKQKHDLSVITSDPLYVGFCSINKSTTQLTLTNCPLKTTMHVTPGKRFNVSVVIMGQRFGLVPGLVVAHCENNSCNISQPEYSQYIDARSPAHRNLSYTVFTKESRNVSLKLVAEDYYSGFPSFRYQPSYVYIIVQKCPLGFIEKNRKCSCLADLQCNITTQTIHRPIPFWIGYKRECCIKSTSAIIIHRFCPMGYCLDNSVSIPTTVDHFYQDVQCAEYRTGLLCGKCNQSYSLGFGSSQCLAGCNTAHRYLQYLRVIGLMAVCAVAGILLVVLLTLFNLTVAEGTLNGLIFYANIVQVNLDLFFPPDTHSRPWTVFIAWLNLDFGVKVCFYDGMDAYVKTWLQFIFPLYIWIISGGIIYFSRKSRRVSKLAGKNSVKVLATLFLLSFGKLIRTVIAAGFFNKVKTYDGTIYSVWLLDANVHYLHGKHIVLFVAASVAGVVALLYALMLTFIQCLRRAPNSRMCGWVQRLKPLLDAYTGPYKNKYHFWTGLLLLVRLTLFTSFALNIDFNPVLNFTLIITVSTLLIIGTQNGIYRNRLIGLLESSVYANLILFSTFTMLSAKSHVAQKTAITCVFGGWTFLTLVGVLLYHSYKNWVANSAIFGHLNQGLWARLKRGNHDRGDAIRPLTIGRCDKYEVSEESDGELDTENELSDQVWTTPRLRESLVGSITTY